MDPLGEILDVEGDIARMLEAERVKAAAWLADTTLALERTAQSEIDRLKAASAEGDTETAQAVEARAEAIVTRATALAERIRRLDDTLLAGIVWEHLQSIVPGPDRDRQNGQD